ELLESTDMIKKALKFEEERFAHTLSSGMEILDKLVKKVKSLKQTKLPGSELFKLYDTFGFPLDLAQDIADDNGLEVDHQGFNEEMERQKTTARASWIGTEDKPPQVYSEIKKELDHTEFLGYETLQSDASVVALIKKNKAADEAGEGEEAEIVLDRSPFYGESGGQVGDTGTIRADNMKFKVSYTKKINNILIHSGTVIRGTINKGMSVQAAVQEDRRRDIMRNHTATHLLHKALKEVLGDHIKQAGSLVAHDRLRFDFNHFFAMDEHEVSEVEEIVNEKIMENIPVDVTESSLDDAISKGVTALFGEKYGQKVRVVRGGDFTAELCGGTHCRATGEIGPFKIVSEGSVASGIRRIEALTGLSSLDFNRERENELKKAAGLLRVNEMGVSGKVKKIIADMKQNEKELEKIKNKATAGNAGGIIKNVIEIGGVKVLAYKAEGMDMKGLRDLSDKLKDKMGSGIIVLGSVLDGNAYYVSVVTKDLVPAFNAGDILKAVTGGKGGGRPDMAQGGTKDTDGIDKAIGSVEGIIKDTSL
ncbi:MAG TPA: alanine--tRNA ligase, partial [Nitrospirae bacterium]|nr:alanine--tRNA ligase [Nitrospirota bacterium]HEW81062.1 alanine--tRNA ligase [Nitrospirota bacterium]